MSHTPNVCSHLWTSLGTVTSCLTELTLYLLNLQFPVEFSFDSLIMQATLTLTLTLREHQDWIRDLAVWVAKARGLCKQNNVTSSSYVL